MSVDFGGTWILPRLIGLHRAKELAFFADVISAEAAEFGFVNKVVPHDELDTEVSDWAERLAAGPPLALAMTKRMLTLNASNDFKSALEAEGWPRPSTFTSDTKEAVVAFLDKREPKFQGN